MPLNLVVRSVFAVSVVGLATIGQAQAYTFSVLYAFQGGQDGASPLGTLLRDTHGDVFGVTYNGGGDCNGSDNAGCGTIFKFSPAGTETVLHKFGPEHHGRNPASGLLKDRASGVFYGTTNYGGSLGLGTVYALAPDGTETVLHSLREHEGYSPKGLAQDSLGNLYGTSYHGGKSSCSTGCGIAFKISPDGTEAGFYKFKGGRDGQNPAAPLIEDVSGNFYGTTFFGGGGMGCTWYPPAGCGTIFKLSPDGTETILYRFGGAADGGNPSTALVLDKSGNLYGATDDGGADNLGVVFKLSPDGTETVLHSFAGGSDGNLIGGSSLLIDSVGNLYGTSAFGGNTGCSGVGCGLVFQIVPNGKEKVLYVFSGGSDGGFPDSLLLDPKGNLFGAAEIDGSGYGTIFKLTP